LNLSWLLVLLLPHAPAPVCPADTLNMQLSAIAQRLMLALQLIPLQKAKAADKRLVGFHS